MVNWWAVLYAVVGFSVAVHFAYRLMQQDEYVQAREQAPPVVIYKEPDGPLRFQFTR